MEVESVNKECVGCGCEATGTIKIKDNYSIELCYSCVKELFWKLSHEDYVFNDD